MKQCQSCKKNLPDAEIDIGCNKCYPCVFFEILGEKIEQINVIPTPHRPIFNERTLEKKRENHPRA
jgi:hypothetical protein